MTRSSSLREITRRIITNSGWLLAARGINAPLAFLESLLLARILGVDLFGTLGIVMTVVTVTKRLTSFRMNEFVVKFVSDALENGRRLEAAAALKIGLLAEALTSVLAWVIALVVARFAATTFVGDAEATQAITLYATIVLSDAVIESTTGALQVFDRFSTQAAARVIRRVLSVAGIGIAYAAGFPFLGTLIAYVAANGVATVYQSVRTHQLATQHLGRDWWRTSLSHAASDRRAMKRFAISTNLGATLALIVKETDLLWLAYFRSPTEAGYYKLATSLLKIPFTASSPLVQSIYPELARTVAKGSVAAVRQIQKRGTRLAALWVVPVTILLAILAPWAIQTFYGSEFLPAVPAVHLMLLGTCIAHLLFWTKPTMLALGKPDVALRITAVNTVLKVLLVVTLVPAGGYLAMAGILSVNYIFGTAATLLVIAASLRAAAD